MWRVHELVQPVRHPEVAVWVMAQDLDPSDRKDELVSHRVVHQDAMDRCWDLQSLFSIRELDERVSIEQEQGAA